MSIVSTRLSELYDFDRIEDSLVALLVGQHLPAQGKRDIDANQTPRVELQLTPGRTEGTRKLIHPTRPSPFQAHDTWNYRLIASVVTNRGVDPAGHRAIVALVRYNLQEYRLRTLLTLENSPLHMIISAIEDDDDEMVIPQHNLDTTRMVFRGLFNIRTEAWEQL